MPNSNTVVDSRIIEGVSKDGLAQIFGMNYRTLSKKILPCHPSGKRGKANIWRIKDVAPYLIKETLPRPEAVEEEPLKPSDEKDLWDARLKQQKYMENEGELWRTDKVITALAEIFKSVKLQILLFSDHVERESGLTEEQRKIIQRKSDELLQSLIEELQEKYGV